MPSLTAVIVDDEPLAREGIAQLLAAEKDVALAGEAADGVEALELIRTVKPDVVFLDIRMPGLDGFGLIGSLPPEERPAIVFITAFDQYAIEAFNAHAVDYLLKPVDPERFRDALSRVRERRSSRQAPQAAAGADNVLALLRSLAGRRQYPERLMIRDAGRIVFVRTADIRYIEAAGDYAQIHTRAEKHLLHETLQDLAARLDPAAFVRIHRSTIVATGSIRELQPLFRGDYAVILHDGTKLTLSRRYREQALAALQGR